MIAYLKGKVLNLEDNKIVLLVNDIGYEVFVSQEFLQSSATGQVKEVFIHHHIREDAMDLYGFSDQNELKFFEQLISISGIGPKTALNILSANKAESLKQAIIKKDLAFLTKISGIGRKTAERMILELEGRLFSLEPDQIGRSSNMDVEVLQALESLGYSQDQVRGVLKEVTAVNESTDAKLKAALKLLARS